MVIIHVKGNEFSLSEYRLTDSTVPCVSVRANAFSFITHILVVGAMTVCFHYSILFMKLWSYVQVNMWCRQSIKEQSTRTRSRSQSISVAELRKYHHGQCQIVHPPSCAAVNPATFYALNISFSFGRGRTRRHLSIRIAQIGEGAQPGHRAIGRLSRQSDSGRSRLLPVLADAVLRAELPAHHSHPEAVPAEAVARSGHRCERRDGPVPAMDDSIGEELIDTVLQYGCGQSHRASAEVSGKTSNRSRA